MYSIEYSNKAKKSLKKMADIKVVNFLISRIEKLAIDPYSMSNVKPMKGFNDSRYRLKVRNFRIVYRIEESKILIYVLEVDTRENIY